MKKPVNPFAVYGRQQTFVFGECEACYVSMSSCVVVNGGQLNGAEARGPVVVQLFRVPASDAAEPVRTCVKLIGKRETVFLLTGAWHEGSPVLKTVVLPVPEGSADPKEGSGGHVFWNGRSPASDSVVRYVRRATSPKDKALRDLLTAGGRGTGERLPPGLAVKPGRPAAARPPKPAPEAAAGAPTESDWAVIAARAFGGGYLVDGCFWVTGDFTRVATRPVKAEADVDIWHMPLFTGLLLKVLLESRKPKGLTSSEIYAAAAILYKQEVEKAKSLGIVLPQDPPHQKALGQFFRVTEGGHTTERKIFRAIQQFGHKPVTYVLSGKWSAQDTGE